jgi:hypothetical protein
MDTENAPSQVPVPRKFTASGSLVVVFKYVVIGTGIIGIGFLIALGGYLLAQKNIQQKKSVSPPTTIIRQSASPN